MKKLVLGVSAVLILAGCGQTQKVLGLTGIEAPDEFLVVKQAPLTLPPDYKTLQAPRPGAPSLGQQQKTNDARGLLLGDEPKRKKSLFSRGDKSEGEDILLATAGANEANPDIRVLLREETEALVQKEGSITNFLITGKSDLATEVDAKAEQRRLQNNLSTGDDINKGNTPTLEEKKKYLIDYFF